MPFLVWLAALVGLFIAHGGLHTACVVVFIVMTLPAALVVLAAAGVIGLAAKGPSRRW